MRLFWAYLHYYYTVYICVHVPVYSKPTFFVYLLWFLFTAMQ